MHSPVGEYLQQILSECAEDDGAVADYIPELAAADPDHLAVALCTPDGTLYTAGDAERRFTIQSISKPFAYALALRDHGIDAVLEKVGVEPSGDAFNEISLEERTGRPENPMINIGAITTHTLVGPADLDEDERTALAIEGLGAFAGRELAVDEDVFASEMSEVWRNLALASLVRANGIISGSPEEAVRGYTRQCAALVDVRDLAVMGMTLARGGVNPLTGEQVVPEEVARQVLSVMTSCGMYDAAGDWLSTVGIPAKSGVAGGILGALPGQVGAGTFSPRLDRFGNSVRGVRVFERLSRDMNLHLMRIPEPSLEVIGRRERTLRGRRLVVLQGALDFASAEMALRHFERIDPSEGDVVVDVGMVSSLNDAARRMLHEGLARLKADGHRVVLVDPHGRLGDMGGGRFPYIARVVPDRRDE
jgi:glutaminase